MNDEFGDFGRSVASTMRRFSPQQRSQAKIEIMQLLDKIEFAQSQPKSNFQTPPGQMSWPDPTGLPYDSPGALASAGNYTELRPAQY